MKRYKFILLPFYYIAYIDLLPIDAFCKPKLNEKYQQMNKENETMAKYT